MEVERFIGQFEGKQKKILVYFHKYFTCDLGLIPKIRFKLPFYYRKSWICYLNPIKGDGIELAFTRGNELSNSSGLLQSKGRRQVYSFDLFSLHELPIAGIREAIEEAILLDEVKPYESKRRMSISKVKTKNRNRK